MGYHKRDIKKGIYGEFSKIEEEFSELQDAFEQNDKILQIVEICDLLGAIEEYSRRNFGLSVSDLKSFSDKTKSAFISGDRG